MKNLTRSRRPATISVSLFAAATLVLAGCSSTLASDSDVRLDLSVREPIPAVGIIEPQTLRIAVAAVLSPEGTVESYEDLATYLGEQLGRPTQLIQRRTYAEVNDLIEANEVDLAFVCTSAYVDGHERSIMDLLVVPEIAGETVYRSAIIVPSSSTATSLTELRDASFAFTDPMSNTGRVYPTFALLQEGEDPEHFFSETIFTYGHDRSIEAVAARVVDGAAVDELVLVNMLKSDPGLADRIRVVDLSPDFGIPPVVVPSGTPASFRNAFTELLLGLEDAPNGPHILSDLGIDRFVLGDDGDYDSVRSMIDAAGIGR
ncbi:MAG: phosphate/phosphite/phosphonate ABC transporter substrate-binding protein [Actinomycetia bacterium]|nr:phosphate/phosphite/phosphonate ABC transporter substrate-binding protein [Actinomycetes bacterium]